MTSASPSTTSPSAPTEHSGAEPSTNPVRAVLNATRVLEELSRRQPIGVSDLARSVGLPKSSVFRLLRTLELAGWTEAVGDENPKWQLTRKVFQVGSTSSGASVVPQRARQAMTELRDRYGETCHFVVHDGDQFIVVLRVDGTKSIRTYLDVGTTGPLISSAAGRAMLSRLDPSVTDKILEHPIVDNTGVTVVDPDRARALVDEARERGYATNHGEWRTAIAAIGAAVVGESGEVLGAISISMPSSQFEQIDVEEVGRHLVDVCARVSAGRNW